MIGTTSRCRWAAALVLVTGIMAFSAPALAIDDKGLPSCSQETGWEPPCEESSVCGDEPDSGGSCVYAVPKDCDQIMQIPVGLGNNTQFKSGLALQVLCQADSIKKKTVEVPEIDFVSHLDWQTLSLTDLPFSVGCSGVSSASFFAWCEYIISTTPRATLLDY